MKENQKRATLKDVAKEAGVSVMAVSNVMNNKGGISQATAQKIREAAAKLNYTPNTAARSLRTSSSKIIGVITSSLYSFLHWDVLTGIDKVAAQNNYSVIIHNASGNAQKEYDGIEMMRGRNIDGLIFVAPIDVSIEALKHIKSLNVPTVLVLRDGKVDGEDYISSVCMDNVHGGYESMKHLLLGGEKDIYMFLNQNNIPSKDRCEGALKALSEYGVSLPDDHVFDIGKFSMDIPSAIIKELIDNGVRDAAIWCASDVIALGAIRAISDNSLTIPDDFRIIGFDGINMIDYMKFPFTTMYQPLVEMGSDASQLLIDQIDGKVTSPVHHIHRSTLKKRISTK